jgi:hypothetical protein
MVGMLWGVGMAEFEAPPSDHVKAEEASSGDIVHPKPRYGKHESWICKEKFQEAK